MTTGEDRKRDDLKTEALRYLKAPVSSPWSNKAHPDLRLL